MESSYFYPMYCLWPSDNGGKRAETARRDVTAETDNCSILSYLEYVTSVLDTHSDWEECSSVRAVKCLFKHSCKGTDCAIVSIVRTGYYQGGDSQQKRPIGERSEFPEAQVIDESEAAWRRLFIEMV